MSSVKDRIRNLQADVAPAADTPAAPPPRSVASLAKSLETAASTPSRGAPSDSLTARLARFDGASLSKPSSTSSTTSVTKNNNQNNNNTSTTTTTPVTSITSTTTSSTVVPSSSIPSSKPTISTITPPASSIAPSTAKTVSADETEPAAVSRRAAVFENNARPGAGSGSGSGSGDDAVAKRAAMFERGGSGEVVRSKDKDKDKEKEKDKDKENGIWTCDNTSSKSVQEQLAEVRAVNEQLVATLVDLTASFRRLEASRDGLQKRLAELESTSGK